MFVIFFREDDEILGLLQEDQIEDDLVYNEAVIAEREGEINRIQSSVVEVNTIFRDLAVIIHDQGMDLQSIDEHISDTSIKTKEVSLLIM
jgi:syntaxin 7